MDILGQVQDNPGLQRALGLSGEEEDAGQSLEWLPKTVPVYLAKRALRGLNDKYRGRKIRAPGPRFFFFFLTTKEDMAT